MSVLILNFVAYDRCPYEKFLKHSGEDLILLTADEYRHHFDENDYAYIESFRNYRHNGCVELRAIELYDKYRYHTIIANAEADILRAAQLRERFQLEGQKMPSAIMYRDKAVMKELAQKHGIPCPPFARINTSFDLIDFVGQHGYPIVMKPADGVGSRDTYVLHNEGDLRALLYEGIPSNYLAEAFVSGHVCHVDGILQEGEIAFICASKYLTEPIKYQNNGYLGSYLLESTDPLAVRLVTMTEQLLRVFDTPANTTFHAEWFHTDDDQVILCEIASRTGGGKIVDSIHQAYEIHLDRAFVETQCQMDPQLPGKKEEIQPKQLTGWVKIPPHKGVFVANPEEILPPWVKEYEYLAVPGRRYDDPNGVREYIASFIVEGSSETDLYDKLINIANWYHHSSKWEDREEE
ncbi:ATP-grasp domain-containing protein [Seinonella peptonophila]|uniref:ATP-grasp domain-containing protein n=1 Tax=Seinonella peptonophila TaxID=112248 RepID=A0A1M4V9D9_9BACL|nr:ATP-grasp domain-containing protein [Seinonella peptonophila]SHE65468.1 ATP-grasp domain-containing protein [Seinonella peptonophila]